MMPGQREKEKAIARFSWCDLIFSDFDIADIVFIIFDAGVGHRER
jgi:hypothetical protein